MILIIISGPEEGVSAGWFKRDSFIDVGICGGYDRCYMMMLFW